MKQPPVISVIVPLYNAEKLISKCVDSLLCQTFSDFELLLVNDGSKDQSGRICDEYALKDPRIRVFHQENGGVASARNTAMEQALGKYLCFIDADDWAESSYLEAFFTKELQQDEKLFVIQDFTEELPEGIRKNGGFSNRLYNPDEFGELLFHNFTFYVPGTPFPKLYHTGIIREHRMTFNTQVLFGEDIVFFLEYMEYVKSVQLLSAAGYHYINFRPSTLSRSYFSHESERVGFTIISSQLKELVRLYGIGNQSEKPVNELSGLYLLRAIYSLYRKGSKKKFTERKAVLKDLYTSENILFLRAYLHDNIHRYLIGLYTKHLHLLFDFAVSCLFFVRYRLR